MQGDRLRTLQSCVPDLPGFFEDPGPYSRPVPPPAGKLPSEVLFITQPLSQNNFLFKIFLLHEEFIMAPCQGPDFSAIVRFSCYTADDNDKNGHEPSSLIIFNLLTWAKVSPSARTFTLSYRP